MKTKILWTAAFLALILQTSYAQYHPMLDQTTWVAYRFSLGAMSAPQNKEIEQATEVQIDGVTYKKFLDPIITADSEVYLREDIAEQKVYSLIDGQEVVIYDFSLQNGNTFTQDGKTYTATVDVIDVNGILRKRIYLEANLLFDNGHPGTLTQTWIEGIGGTSHPLKPYFNANAKYYSGHSFIYMKCSFQNGVHTYGETDCLAFLATDDYHPQIGISPNPFKTSLRIENASGFQNVTLRLFDTTGRLVRQQSNLNGTEIQLDRGNLKSGCYLLQLSAREGVLKTEKIMVD